MAWLRLARVFQKIDRASEVHLRLWNLSVAQFDILAQVEAAKRITQQELADRLLVTKGNISQLLDRMEQRGLLTRCHEGRVNILSLTEEGQRLYAQVVPAQEKIVEEHFSALSSQEASQLLRLLRKMDRAIQ
jgi:DNA-binding MarR family transcriptional regulator